MTFDIVAGSSHERVTDWFAPSENPFTANCFGREPIVNGRENEPAASPYRLRLASYLPKREKLCGETAALPDQLRSRVLVVRSFDKDAVLVADEVVEGRDIEMAIERQLADPRAAYLHIRYALCGRYAARVERH